MKDILVVLGFVTGTLGLVSMQGTPPAGQERGQTPEQAVTFIGCVERVEPPAAPTGKPSAPAYKLIDIQPGTGQRMQRPVSPETQFLLDAPASIKLSDFQNQRVEVTGTLTASARPADSPQRGEARGAVIPASTLSVKTAKVVSTECKAPKV